MAKRLKKIPKFKFEDKEREFWDTHSSVDYVDWSKAKRAVFPNLKPTSSRPISIRIPDHLVDTVKMKANKLNIPYQTLMKQYIARGVLSREKF